MVYACADVAALSDWNLSATCGPTAGSSNILKSVGPHPGSLP